jgi:dolichol-phosphate mannosyltransferase
MQLSVVIPCYNEEANVRALDARLRPVLEGLRDRFDDIEVVLVDDGSRDGTWAAMQELTAARRAGPRFRAEKHPTNLGLGAAIRTGLSAATGDVIVTTDSDATYRFEDIPALLDVLGPDVDLVTASPYHPQGAVDNVPGYRLFFSRGASFLYRLLVQWNLYTWTALFRAYRQPVVRTVPFASTGFLAGTEILVNAIHAGYRAAEFPTVLRSRVHGVSKAKIARTIRAHLRFQGLLLRRRLRLGGRPEGTPAVPSRS